MGVSRSATTREIKKAYRALSKTSHPDKNPGDKALADKWVEINEAHDVLSNADKRRIYDQYGEDGLKNPQQAGGFDPFADLFGFGRRKGQQNNEMRQGPSMEIPLEVTLADIYIGKELSVYHKKQVLCTECRGTGAEHPDDFQKCTDCGGSGIKTVTKRLGPGFVQQMQQQCSTCGGTGHTIKSTCPHCKGTKVERGGHSLTLIIERGMPNGHKIKFAGECDEVPDQQPGDLYFVVSTVPHEYFRRDGSNLRMKMRITLLEALVGFEKKLTHLDGHEVVITRAAVTTPGYVQTIRGEGMPVHEWSSDHGDLLIEYSIRFPARLSASQKQAFKDILKV